MTIGGRIALFTVPAVVLGFILGIFLTEAVLPRLFLIKLAGVEISFQEHLTANKPRDVRVEYEQLFERLRSENHTELYSMKAMPRLCDIYHHCGSIPDDTVKAMIDSILGDKEMARNMLFSSMSLSVSCGR